jgi:hypothetical protein
MMPALLMIMSRRNSRARKVLGAALAEAKEARSSFRKEMGALLGLDSVRSLMACSAFCWDLAAR